MEKLGELTKINSCQKNGDTLETKFFGAVSSPDDLGPTLTAMANTKGGYLFIGVDVKNYHLMGTTIDRKWIDDMLVF